MKSFFEKSSQKAVLVTNPCPHLHILCAAGVSRGLTTSMALTGASLERMGEGRGGAGPASDFIFLPYCMIVDGLRLKR
jgi:hypothetical protein